MYNKPDFKEYHIDKNGKKVAGAYHQTYKWTHPDPFIMIETKQPNLVDPFVVK